MENKQCKHQYESRIINKQKRDINYVSSTEKQDRVTLNVEEHYIFCIYCGDYKLISLKGNDNKN